MKRLLSTLRFYLLHKFVGRMPLPCDFDCHARFSFRDVLLLTNTPWYHDFAPLGVPTPQKGGYYVQNQKDKQRALLPLIEKAIEKCVSQRASGLELFCADGFFSMFALKHGASCMVGVDINASDLEHANLMTRIFGFESRARFCQQDVFDHKGEYEFGICAGGLYHVDDPTRLLVRLRDQVKGPLVIQTVFSLRHEAPDYFETPAPHLTWGCRFSWRYLMRMVQTPGWRIVESSRGELRANPLPDDRGSAYLLCVPSTN